MKGELLVGILGSLDSGNKLYSRLVRAGETFLILRGLMHFQFNVGKTEASMVVSFNSQNPGIVFVPLTLFGSNPPIPTLVLTKALRVEAGGVELLKSNFAVPSPSLRDAAHLSPPPPPPPARRRGGGGGGGGAPDPAPAPRASGGEERDHLRAAPALRPPGGPLPGQRHRLLARRQRQPLRGPRGALLRALRVPHLLRAPRHGRAPLRLPHRARGRAGPPLPRLVQRRPRQGRPAPAPALRLPRHRLDHPQAPRRRLPVRPRLRGRQEEEVPPLLRARCRRRLVPGLLCPILGDAEGLILWHHHTSLQPNAS